MDYDHVDILSSLFEVLGGIAAPSVTCGAEGFTMAFRQGDTLLCTLFYCPDRAAGLEINENSLPDTLVYALIGIASIHDLTLSEGRDRHVDE